MKKTKTPAAPGRFRNQPFRGLTDLDLSPPPEDAPGRPKAAPVRPEPPRPAVQAVEEDEDGLFARAMQGAAPLVPRGEPPRKRPPERPPEDEDALALLELQRLVRGDAPFDIAETDEYLEGRVRGVSDLLLKRLRAGDYSIQAQIDLHGLSRTEARDTLERFLAESRVRGRRCVLVVHGRGLHSKDMQPVLKESLRVWFERGKGRLGGHVLAFTTARPADGGWGAMYVLLKGG